jgi:hypothetical protein
MDLMKKLIELLKSLFARREPGYDEDYLAQAVDIYDLERRMQVLEGRRLHNTFYPAGTHC